MSHAAILACAGNRGGIDALLGGLITHGGRKIVRVLPALLGRIGRRGGSLHARGRDFLGAVFLFLRGGFRRGGGLLVDAGHDLPDLDRVARLHEMLQRAGAFRHDLGRHLVGLDFKKGLTRLDVCAVRLAPDAEDAGGDRFADGGDFDFDGHS